MVQKTSIGKVYMRPHLNCIGIMTGNSLDGADLVLTRFSRDGGITDLVAHSISSTPELADALRHVRQVINDEKGQMPKVVQRLTKDSPFGTFDDIEDRYTKFIADGVRQLSAKARAAGIIGVDGEEIDVVGSHGQTCAHCPSSIVRSEVAANASSDELDAHTYTVQIGDPQKLANLLQLTVVADFRSDDLMHGGEGAPLAPVHHQHLANQTRANGNFPIAFCNAGNTGNISVITEDMNNGELKVVGFDTGPFNHFPDKLMQCEKGQSCDVDGAVGISGNVHLGLLKLLFDKAVCTSTGENFLLKPPPRSSDPQWYIVLPELAGTSVVASESVRFEDRLRTAEYFSAYIFFYALSHVDVTLKLPSHYALCGGGWKNPVVRQHFEALLRGDNDFSPVLLEHREIFGELLDRLKGPDLSSSVMVQDSSRYGFDGTAMEARIFADAAFCRIIGEHFSTPGTTGVKHPVVLGIIRFADLDSNNSSSTVQEWLTEFHSSHLTMDDGRIFDPRWSRASAGWKELAAKL